uniref:Ribosomal protein L10 n=1 Tax=Najas guadalupensis TaxID=403037 RepID=A0A1Z1R0E4_9LILI|nr:ribosomal protein L10 [Najas guadalupensis]
MRQFGRRFQDQESRVSGTEMMVSFHSSGSTSHQWRKLNNPGRTPFRPRTEKGCFAQLDQGAGPTCISSLAEEASDRSDFLPSFDQDLLSLYGQYRSTLVSHMDVDQAHSLEPQELERSLFHFHLPSSYLSFVCSHLSRSSLPVDLYLPPSG